MFNLLISLLTLPIYLTSFSLIFVQLGDCIPPCIFTTMKQARYLNPTCDLYLLADKKAHTLFQNNFQKFFQEEGIILVDMDPIPISDEHATFQKIHKLDLSITNGFWVYTSERFFTLFDFLQEMPLEEVLHLESDCMIYIGLEELIPQFRELDLHLAAPFQSLKGCIPCFVFIKNRKSLSLLIDHILSEMQNYKGTTAHIAINDMQTLASFYLKFGANYLLPLPTLMDEYQKYYSKRKSRFAQDNATPLSFLSLNAHLFPNSIFDAAGLGIFINGHDRKFSPQNGPGTIHPRSLFNPSFFSYFWGKDSQDRIVPYLSFKGNNFRIMNLHFHSKMPEEYTSFGETRANLPARKCPS